MREGARGFLPGIDAALDVARGGNPRILGRLDRHCGAFAEGAVKQKLLARRFRELVQNP
jgi:hypothetical protein